MSYSTSSWEREVIAGEFGHEMFLQAFAEEIKDLATWLNRAPESADIEAHFEQICETHDFDASDDGFGTNWDWVRDCFEDWSPRLRAARILRERG